MTERIDNAAPMTIEQVAEMYGVSRRTVHRWIASGKLHAFKLAGGSVRIQRSDAEALLEPVEVAS